MNVKEIIELIDFISKKKLEEINIETQDIKLTLKKSTGSKVVEQVVTTPQAPPPQPQVSQAPQQQAPQPPQQNDNAAKSEPKKKYVEVKSPMIGTFYRSPNPETSAFVNVGDKVEVGQTVCMIEAMKLFNEIESEISGSIVEVLVENATPVEYDQPLFLVDPS